jgi:hypothetical protein
MVSMCAVTMCPLVAPFGSPWTGNKEAECAVVACHWHDFNNVDGCLAVNEGLTAIASLEKSTPEELRVEAKLFDCPKAEICKWQQQSEGLCPPRLALSKGIHPRVTLF